MTTMKKSPTKRSAPTWPPQPTRNTRIVKRYTWARGRHGGNLRVIELEGFFATHPFGRKYFVITRGVMRTGRKYFVITRGGMRTAGPNTVPPRKTLGADEVRATPEAIRHKLAGMLTKLRDLYLRAYKNEQKRLAELKKAKVIIKGLPDKK